MLTETQASAVAAYLITHTPGTDGELDHSYISAWQMSCEALEALGYATETARGALLHPPRCFLLFCPGGMIRAASCSPLRSSQAGSSSGTPGPSRQTRPVLVQRTRKPLPY